MPRSLDLNSAATLPGGVRMPYFGLGVWQAEKGAQTREAVRAALALGYRHIDTARAYGNEEDVGAAIRDSGVPREEVFVVTKLWNKDHGYDQALEAFEKSNRRLGLGYVDLYLIHWPVEGLRGDTWRAFEKLLRDGACRAIGVSNYTTRHLQELLDTAQTPPAVNQVEFHPFLYQRQLLEYCRGKGIQLEAYSPLVQGRKFDDPVIQDIARMHARTPAQVMIRWCLEHEVVVIPKSVNRQRLEENARVFDFALDADDMARLDGLDEGLRVCWDPTDAR
ncbi:MAG: aldo/keto reductase [Candidatus Sericytochromatia bacterium]|nr:aldo/keto reductase [Candidatus Tanganyikabacteria bacterium]